MEDKDKVLYSFSISHRKAINFRFVSMQVHNLIIISRVKIEYLPSKPSREVKEGFLKARSIQ